ncbi:conjugal transfer protein TrbA [Pectobacterium carotovorum]|uniref:secretion/conjugation apparatus DotM-related subunit n=1 Tax=Pectobacterium carotovorum TaxID=554 RepID=UPI0029DBF079|nr:conjugal transfer protein TrbA [Pectobacterium carotovorum]MDX6917833.1 conjugal transfer protein TrbA [Pectobacterium carotovorum]
MTQPVRKDVQSNNDWTMAAVGLFITLMVTALFFRQLTIECTTTLLYWLWSLADFQQFHNAAAWRINLLATTHNNAENVSWGKFFTVMDATAGILLIALIPLAIIGIIAVRRHQASRTSRDISINTLPRIMAQFSPAILPALSYGDRKTQLLNVDPAEHRSAQTPDEFVIEHKLVVNNRLKKDQAEKLFIAQLGTPLQHDKKDFDRFNDHERAMFAIFGLQHFLDKRGEAEQLLDALNRSTLKSDRKYRNKIGYPNLAMATSAFRKVTETPAAQKWIKQYNYARTSITALHDNDLHLPIRRYRWLKGLDRTLWYALASTGRPWPFVEGAGVVSQAHWEKLASRYRVRLTKPIMSLAIEGLETDLRNLGAVVEEPAPTKPSLHDVDDADEDEDEAGNNQLMNSTTDEQHVHRHVHTFRPKMR